MLNLPDFLLPEELIANQPASPRDHARLLKLDRQTGAVSHHHFYDLPDLIKPTDVLVFNQTKVFPARLFGTKATGGKIEVLLLKQLENNHWQALTKPGLKLNQSVSFSPHLAATVSSMNPDQTLNLQFTTDLRSDIFDLISKHGHMPLPPYIHSLQSEQTLKREYQTVYAKQVGSAAAPTAGLHFTNELIDKLRQQGVQTEFVTLHVGLGTFKPLTQENIKTGKLHSEVYEIDKPTADRLNLAKSQGRRIIAVGTTTTRVLESCVVGAQRVAPSQGETDIFIYPPYKFKFIDGLITNFHLPQSSLLLLVSAFTAHPEFVLDAYQTAIHENYRFYSFGDAMLIL